MPRQILETRIEDRFAHSERSIRPLVAHAQECPFAGHASAPEMGDDRVVIEVQS